VGYAVIHAEGNRLLTARGVSIWMAPFWGGVCGVKSCCESKGLDHCGECGGFPCEMLSTMGVEEGFDPAPKLEQCRQWACEKKE